MGDPSTITLTATDLILIRGEFTDDTINVAVALTDTYTVVRSYASGNLPIARYAWTATSDTTTTTTTDWTAETMTATGDSGALTATLEAPGTGNTSRAVSLVIYGITGTLGTITVTNGSDTQLAKYDADLVDMRVAPGTTPYTDPQSKKWYVQGTGWSYREMTGVIFPSRTLKQNVRSTSIRQGLAGVPA